MRLYTLAEALRVLIDNKPHKNFNIVRSLIDQYQIKKYVHLTKNDLKLLFDTFTEKDETAEPVIKQQTKAGIIYESDPDLRDTEKVPLKETIDDYFAREVLSYFPDAWIDDEKTVRGYEIRFAKYFYKYQPLRSLVEITSDILALEAKTEGLLSRIIREGKKAQ